MGVLGGPGGRPTLRILAIAICLLLPHNDSLFVASNRHDKVFCEPLDSINACRVPRESEEDLWRGQGCLIGLLSRSLVKGVQNENRVACCVRNEPILSIEVHCLENRVRVGGDQDIIDLNAHLCLNH